MGVFASARFRYGDVLTGEILMSSESMEQTISVFPNDNTSPQQALLDMLNLVGERGLKDVLIVAADKDGNIVVRSSAMTNKDALWLALSSALHAMGILRDD